MISHINKFVFIHIPKCAGTSIDSCLFKFCDLYDETYSYRDIWERYDKLEQQKHESIRYYFKKQNLNDYFKFTFVRNPWDKILSMYLFRQKEYNVYPMSFERFVKIRVNRWNTLSKKHWKSNHNSIQYNWLCNRNGEMSMDFIGRFENLQEDFSIVCDKIGIPKQQLPHKNTTNHKHYTEYYDDETRQIVAKKYAKDIEYFGYKFGE